MGFISVLCLWRAGHGRARSQCGCMLLAPGNWSRRDESLQRKEGLGGRKFETDDGKPTYSGVTFPPVAGVKRYEVEERDKLDIKAHHCILSFVSGVSSRLTVRGRRGVSLRLAVLPSTKAVCIRSHIDRLIYRNPL
jgi:hypothetical protein